LTVSDAYAKKPASGQVNAGFTVFSDFAIQGDTTFTATPSDFVATAAENDYVTTPVSVTLAATATSTTFNVPILGDTIAEGNETFRVTLSNATNGAVLAPRIAEQDGGVAGRGLGMIVDA